MSFWNGEDSKAGDPFCNGDFRPALLYRIAAEDAMSTGRRLAAVLAADVVGYSRLIGEDESGTVKSVREHREALKPIVRGLGGRLVKTMGDGVLLEFSSVIAAVECAIAIQKQMVQRNIGVSEAKRILYRISRRCPDRRPGHPWRRRQHSRAT
jgi:class 3 adenylate cyclase